VFSPECVRGAGGNDNEAGVLFVEFFDEFLSGNLYSARFDIVRSRSGSMEMNEKRDALVEAIREIAEIRRTRVVSIASRDARLKLLSGEA